MYVVVVENADGHGWEVGTDFETGNQEEEEMMPDDSFFLLPKQCQFLLLLL